MACLHPITLYRDGNYIRVPCGHCVGCLNQKGKLYSDLCDLESKSALATFFVTLTYSDDHVPYLNVVPTAYDDQGVCEVTLLCKSPRLSGVYDDNIVDQLDVNQSTYDRMILPISDDRVKLPSSFGDNAITFCYKPDIIKFLKRVRYYVSRIDSKNTELRYFFVSEYGPKTFRAHYHGLLYVYSSKVKEKLSSIVSKAWKFGRVDCQLSGARGCVNYVAKYVNSNTCLPIILQQKVLKTWTLHSQYFGSRQNEAHYNALDKLTYRSIANQVFIVSQHYVKGYRIPSLQAKFFPRCYRFGISDARLSLYRYKVYWYLRKLTSYEKVEDIVSYCADRDYNVSLDEYNLLDLICLSENYESCLRSMLYVSRKFLRLCKRFNVSAYRYYHIICDFYNDMDLDNLNSFYEKYQEDSKEHGLPVDYLYRYSNIPIFSRSDYMYAFRSADLDNPLISVYNKIRNFADSIHVDPLICVDVLCDYENLFDYIDNYTLQHKIASDNVKHKIINDLNKLLYG